jgi:uncharacterized protein YbaR (Trm112 family)
MIDCPNCAKPMVSLSLSTTIGMAVEAGECADCALLWFDGGSASRLAPASVLQVFQAIGTGGSGSGAPLRAEFACPRCRSPLAFVHDLQRNTRFTHWRCASDRGELVAFTQFLREKNFIRTPSAEELEKLRRDVRQITCSQCGAPIDLQKDSACPFCHAPIALVDSEGIAAAVRDLRANTPVDALASPAAVAPSTSALADVQLGAILDPERIRQHVGPHDLLAIGVAAIGMLLRDLL